MDLKIASAGFENRLKSKVKGALRSSLREVLQEIDPTSDERAAFSGRSDSDDELQRGYIKVIKWLAEK
ncbi:hypothetical protein [Bacteroidetes bacterium endosymbiont of Geopemphigus sp.]|uniref:hypothetical protein n=1 Tax=Bacteroidetes bacterium endosymbiont of Geopemphigus sp. TaxID=2047937 RepID=UPI000CD0CF3E|nr:hypothetical protein [Bacteroidetes bacterium endosymbiont of Geopemphigus sp.]